jgi:hypothetical protein
MNSGTAAARQKGIGRQWPLAEPDPENDHAAFFRKPELAAAPRRG